jgi:hypothetical protein
VVALEMRPSADSDARYLKILSVHGDADQEYRVEIRKLHLEGSRSLEDILEDEDGHAWHGGEQVEQLIGLPTCTLAWASRKADCGFYAAKTAYYRAVLGALHCARTEPRRLAWRPGCPARRSECFAAPIQRAAAIDLRGNLKPYLRRRGIPPSRRQSLMRLQIVVQYAPVA